MKSPTTTLLRLARLALGGACLSGAALAATADDTPAWITKSNAHAQVLLDATNKFQPEGASQTGFPGFDDKVADLQPGITQRYVAAETAARDELAKRILTETDPLVRQDLEILVKAASNDIETTLLQDKMLLTYIDVGQLVYFGEFGLLQDQVDATRRPAALKRLKLYAGLEPGSTPITELAKARYTEEAVVPPALAPSRAASSKASPTSIATLRASVSFIRNTASTSSKAPPRHLMHSRNS